ncbi:MAG: F0F1 ATP synthase subunit epsilon [Candidatus Omnitrophica bacterium]|nr:F0F1 ATP synthase subunit epsilon [Candidatus Omnitrophota bacterium]
MEGKQDKFFSFSIVTPEKIIFQGKLLSLVVPCEGGYLGVLASHAPLIANIVPGKIFLKEATGTHQTIDSQGNGFLEVLKNNVTMLLDRVE